MNQYTAKKCPIHWIRMKLVYTMEYKAEDGSGRKMNVYDGPRCVECLRDHDAECTMGRGKRPRITKSI